MSWRYFLRADGHVMVLALVAVVFLLQVGAQSGKTPSVDNMSIAVAAANLLDQATYSEARPAGAGGALAPGLSLAPGYPAILAALAVFDPRMADHLRCLAAGRDGCGRGNPFRSLLLLQTLAGLIALALGCFVARELSGSVEIAGLATLLAFIMGRFVEFAVVVQPHGLLRMLALALGALLLVTHRRRSIPMAALGGVVVGVLALIEVQYVALIVLVPLLILAAEHVRPEPRRAFACYGAAAFALAGGLVLAPWMVRNHLLFGDAILTDNTVAKLFSERAAYNGPSLGEMLTGTLCWVPGFGDLAKLVLPTETVRKFDLYYEGSLLFEGERILAASGAAAGGESTFVRLLRSYVLGDPLSYAASSAILLLRGLRATGGLLVLWGLLALPLLLRRMRAHGSLGPFLMVAGAPVALAVVQALLTANLPWMNLGLVFIYAYAIAQVAGGLELPIGLRRLLAAGRAAQARKADPSGRVTA